MTQAYRFLILFITNLIKTYEKYKHYKPYTFHQTKNKSVI